MKEAELDRKQFKPDKSSTIDSKIEIYKKEISEKNLLNEKELLYRLDEEQKKRLYLLESELYADLATLQSLSKNFEEGRIDPPTFKRQLKSLIKNAFKNKHELEQLRLDVFDFIKSEGFLEEFSLAVKKLKLESNESNNSMIYDILFESPGKIAEKTYDIVTNFDTLSDLLKLKYNATNELTVSLLNDLFISFRNFPGFGSENWICREISDWRNRLSSNKPNDLLDENNVLKLDGQLTIWKNEFYQKIKEVSF